MADPNPTPEFRKTCFRCGETKSCRAFYRHRQMGDGYLGKCKDCAKADARRYWADNADVLRQTDRVRRKLRARIKDDARNAVRDGKLTIPDKCHYCDRPPAEAHHWNYYRPLDVTWLCRRCHSIADMARRDAETKVAIYRE